WTYDEVCHAADSAGAGLLDMGLAPGDRVILATRDRPEFVITFWGAIKAGLVPVPVPDGLSAEDVRFIASDSEARAIVCDPTSAPTVVRAVDGIPCLLAGGSATAGTRAWSEVCDTGANLAAAST